MTKRQVINQFMFEEGQDAYKFGIGASEHLLVDKHEGIAKYGKKPVSTSLRQMPQLVSWSLPLSTQIFYTFKRDDTIYALATDPNTSDALCIVEYDSDGGYAIRGSIATQTDPASFISGDISSCQCGDYEFFLIPAMQGTIMLVYNVESHSLTEVYVPRNGGIKATCICYWAGHLFLNDEYSDKIWYSDVVLTATEIGDIFVSETYRSMAYKDGKSLYVGVLNGALWSVSSSYIQKWTDSDSTLVPIYANTASLIEMHTYKALPYYGGVLLASSDIQGIKHLYSFEGNTLNAIETEELAKLLYEGAYPNRAMLVSFEQHSLIVTQFDSSTYVYDISNGLWAKSSYWSNALQVSQDIGIQSNTNTRVSKVQVPNPGKNWSRLGSIWLDGNVDFYCDRITLKVRTTKSAASPKVTVRYRMRNMESDEPDFISEYFTTDIGNSEIQCMNCGYGNILDLKVECSGAIELYDVRAEITSGGRW